MPPEPAEHTGVAVGHTVWHPPQVVACDRSVSHPSAGLRLQSAHPGAHADSAKEHAPAEQVAAPLTWANAVHALPQAPQLPVSLVTSKHAPPQGV